LAEAKSVPELFHPDDAFLRSREGFRYLLTISFAEVRMSRYQFASSSSKRLLWLPEPEEFFDRDPGGGFHECLSVHFGNCRHPGSHIIDIDEEDWPMIRIKLRPELSALTAEAQARGLKSALMSRACWKKLSPRAVSVRRQPTPEEMRAFFEAMRRSETVPQLPDEAFQRASFYQDHD